MHVRRAPLLVGACLTASAIILGLVGVRDQIEQLVDLPELVYISGVLFAIGLLVVAALVWSSSRINSHLSERVRYECVRVEKSQIPETYRFIREVLGDEVASIERVSLWCAKNPDVLYAIYQERQLLFKRVVRIVGFFSIFPMTREATALLKKNLLKGTEFTDQHIVPRGRQPAAFYIGAVGAKGFRAREQTLLMLMGYIASLTTRKTPLVFTRPVTPDGLRLAGRYLFEPVLPGWSDSREVVYMRDFSNGTVAV